MKAAAGLSYQLLYLITGNKKLCEIRSKDRLCTYNKYMDSSSHLKPNRDLKLIPHTMGGIWATYPGLLEAAMQADLELAPKDYDDRELDYYPLAQPGIDNEKPGTIYNLMNLLI